MGQQNADRNKEYRHGKTSVSPRQVRNLSFPGKNVLCKDFVWQNLGNAN